MIEFVGGAKVERDLHGVAERLATPSVILAREASVLEASEAGTFAELGGRYVATGTTMRSLTMPDAPHAVRRVVAGTLEFGTDVRYARYLTEHIGPATEAGGMARPKPVAVLKLTAATRQQIAHDVINHVAGEGTLGLGSAFVEGML